ETVSPLLRERPEHPRKIRLPQDRAQRRKLPLHEKDFRGCRLRSYGFELAAEPLEELVVDGEPLLGIANRRSEAFGQGQPAVARGDVVERRGQARYARRECALAARAR